MDAEAETETETETDQIEPAESDQTPSQELSEEPEKDRLDQSQSPPKQVRSGHFLSGSLSLVGSFFKTRFFHIQNERFQSMF